MSDKNTNVISFKDAVQFLKKDPLAILNYLIELYRAGEPLINAAYLNPQLKEHDLVVDEIKAKLEVQKAFENKANGKGQKGKVPIRCLFHDTLSNDSTYLIIKEYGASIGCFSGKCEHLSGGMMNVFDAFIYVKHGVKNKNKFEMDKMSPEMAKETEKKQKKLFAETIKELSLAILKRPLENNFVPKKPKILTEEEIRERRLRKLCNDIRDVYHQWFKESKEAQNYFLENSGSNRGFKNAINPQHIIDHYKIGFAPQTFPSEALIEALEGEYSTEELLEVGAVVMNSSKTFLRDMHNYGLMICYWDEEMGATNKRYHRSMDPKVEKSHRHIRTSGEGEHPLNYYQAIKYGSKINAVEGEITLLSAIGMGLNNTIATFGTNGFQDRYMEMLAGSGIQKVNLIYDADEPGLIAAIKVGRKLIKHGIDVTVTLLKKGMDANDYLKKDLADEFNKAVNEAIPFYKFYARFEWERHNNSAEMIGRFKEIISEDELDDTKKFVMSEYLAEESGIPFDIIWSAVHKTSNNKNMELLHSESFAYVTNNLESFYLMNFATYTKTGGVTLYLEDVEELVVSEDEYRTKLFIVESKNYNTDELEKIKQFCVETYSKFAVVEDFKKYIDSSMNFEALKTEILKV